MWQLPAKLPGCCVPDIILKLGYPKGCREIVSTSGKFKSLAELCNATSPWMEETADAEAGRAHPEHNVLEFFATFNPASCMLIYMDIAL